MGTSWIKNSIIIIDLAAVLVSSLVLISFNSFPLVDSRVFLPKYPASMPLSFKFPNKNNDGTMTYYYSYSVIESAQIKSFLLDKYVVITLKPEVGPAVPNQGRVTIALPAGLVSTGPVKLVPEALTAFQGKHIQTTVVFKSQRDRYTYLDAKSWYISKVET